MTQHVECVVILHPEIDADPAGQTRPDPHRSRD
jgi:hypothetical protein